MSIGVDNKMTKFPANPEHGTIFEISSGVYYIYDLSTSSWSRSEGGLLPQLATPVTDGLMAAEDLRKLNKLILPPPQSTITSEDCGVTFSQGYISLSSADQFIVINGEESLRPFSSVSGKAKLMNKAAGITEDNAIIVDRSLHLHSHSFDFKLNLEELRNYLIDTNRLRVITNKGLTGQQGLRGDDGDDELPYGAVGEQGDRGQSALFSGSLISEPIQFRKRSNDRLAVVNIDTKVDGDDNYLVVTRANIGNPDACPNRVIINSDVSSTWLVALPTDVGINAARRVIGNDCVISIESGGIYYLDIEPLLDAIKSEFETQVSRIKDSMENIVRWWLSVMSAVFDEQKSALCCALEYCKSQSRNNTTRQYIEQSRIQAAASNHSVTMDTAPLSDTSVSTVVKTPMSPVCGAGFGTDIGSIPGSVSQEIVTLVGRYTDGIVSSISSVSNNAILKNKAKTDFETLGADSDCRVVIETAGNVSAAKTVTILSVSNAVSNYFSLVFTYYTSTGGRGTSKTGNIPYNASANQVKAALASLAQIGPNNVSVTGAVGGPWEITLNDIVRPRATIVFSPDSGIESYFYIYLNSLTPSPGKKATVYYENVGRDEVLGAVVGTYDVHSVDSTLINLVGYPVLRPGTAFTFRIERVTQTQSPEPGDGLSPNNRFPISGSTCFPALTIVDGNPVIYEQCPPGFTPRSIYQELSRTYGQNGNTVIVQSVNQPIVYADADEFLNANVDHQASINSILSNGGVIRSDLSADGLRLLRSESTATGLAVQVVSPQVLDFTIKFTNAIDVPPKEDEQEFIRSKSRIINSGYLYQWNEEVYGRDYVVNIKNNGDDIAGPIYVILASQNSSVINGSANGAVIRVVYDKTFIDGIEYAPNTVCVLDNGMSSGAQVWLMISIYSLAELQEPYVEKCGSVGPRLGYVDGLICHERLDGSGNPLLRETGVRPGSRGLFDGWDTSKCGEYFVPDVISIKMSGKFESLGELVACRVRGGNYSLGVGFQETSSQILIEQIDSLEIDHASHLNPPSTLKLESDIKGGNKYKCTLLNWDNSDCSGNISSYSSVVVAAKCDKWHLVGSWDIGGELIDFSANEFIKANNKEDKTEYLTLHVKAINSDNLKKTVGYLAQGEYVVDIIECCIGSDLKYFGNVDVGFKKQGVSVIQRFTDVGTFEHQELARLAYRGLSMTITHDGGPVFAKLSSPTSEQLTGVVSVRFSRLNKKIERSYNSRVVGDKCQFVAAYLEWVMDGLANALAQGYSTNIAGQDYLIVRRPGSTNQCVEIHGDFAVAWPTLDGLKPAWLPSGLLTFKFDKTLQDMVDTNIKSGLYSNARGDISMIKKVLFPIS